MVIDICKELGQNFIDFSYEANSARAFADARDGLKPGQRACLWEMFNSGYSSKKPHVKSAKIAGAVTGNWWPHGDVAIYETFARMSQPWINNIPEVSWHGNNGSQYTGPECASSRYTEARLSSVVEDGMFEGIKKNNVNMIKNYSEDMDWPEVLPAVFPRLMVNGCQGIGSTIANVWLPHSFSDIATVLNTYIETEEVDINNLYPSFPTGGIIINKNDIHTIYETGKGKVILRGRAEIKGQKILITELPYQVYVQPYVEELTAMAIKDEITGIETVLNKSGKKTLLIEIECSESPSHVLNQLYNKTDLQKSYNANQWALVGKTPVLLTLKDYCKIYVEHNINCIINEAKFDLEKAQSRYHVVEGLLKALEDIDNIINLIKQSVSSADAKNKLIQKYNFTEIQAKSILAMKLSSLANLEKIELQQEEQALLKEIEELGILISVPEVQKNELKNRLNSLVKKYGDTRKTELTHIILPKEEKEIEEVIPEDVVVVLTQAGDIKKIPTASFKVQKKGGKGVKTADDAILDVISTNTIDTLMFFTNKGKMYRLVVDNVPSGTNATKGIKLNTLITLEAGETVIAMSSMYRKTTAKYVVFFTKNGLIKKSLLDEYTKVKKSTGIQAIKIADGDSIANVTFMEDEEVVAITKKGMIIRFETKNITPIGKVAMGVKCIKLAEGDEILIGLPIKHTTDSLAIISADGVGKKTPLTEYPIQNRGGKGLICSKTEVAGAALVSDEDILLLTGKPSSICISSKDIPLLNRVASGNILSRSKVNSVIKL